MHTVRIVTCITNERDTLCISRCVSRSVAFVLPCILYACMYCIYIFESNYVELQINLFIIIIIIIILLIPKSDRVNVR